MEPIEIKDIGLVLNLTSWGWLATDSRSCFLLTRCCDVKAEPSPDSSTGAICGECRNEVAAAYIDSLPNERLQDLLARYGGPIGGPA